MANIDRPKNNPRACSICQSAQSKLFEETFVPSIPYNPNYIFDKNVGCNLNNDEILALVQKLIAFQEWTFYSQSSEFSDNELDFLNYIDADEELTVSKGEPGYDEVRRLEKETQNSYIGGTTLRFKRGEFGYNILLREKYKDVNEIERLFFNNDDVLNFYTCFNKIADVYKRQVKSGILLDEEISFDLDSLNIPLTTEEIVVDKKIGIDLYYDMQMEMGQQIADEVNNIFFYLNEIEKLKPTIKLRTNEDITSVVTNNQSNSLSEEINLNSNIFRKSGKTIYNSDFRDIYDDFTDPEPRYADLNSQSVTLSYNAENYLTLDTSTNINFRYTENGYIKQEGRSPVILDQTATTTFNASQGFKSEVYVNDALTYTQEEVPKFTQFDYNRGLLVNLYDKLDEVLGSFSQKNEILNTFNNRKVEILTNRYGN